MKRNLLVIILCYSAFFILSCSTIQERKQNECGLLESAVISSIEVINGRYPDKLPDNFDACDYLKIVKGHIPEDQFNELQRKRIVIIPKGWYYLAKIYNQNCEMILFDYSCDSYIDGKVWENPTEFELNDMEKYDSCRTS